MVSSSAGVCTEGLFSWARSDALIRWCTRTPSLITAIRISFVASRRQGLRVVNVATHGALVEGVRPRETCDDVKTTVRELLHHVRV